MSAFKNYLFKQFRKRLAGKKSFQRLFNLTKILSLEGLNYGNGGSIEISGELSLLQKLNKEYVENRAYIVFDAGANQGDYCSALIENIQIKDLQIWCFEPSKDTFKKLQLSHANTPNVFLNNIGFSNKDEEIPLYTNEPGSLVASLYPLERPTGLSAKLSDFEMVSIKTIDGFLAEKNIPYIDLLKLDIEGNELNALMGANDALNSGKIKAIQFEFGTCNIDSRTFFRDFWNLLSPKYRLYRLVKDGLQPITSYIEYEEVFATINYYAELK